MLRIRLLKGRATVGFYPLTEALLVGRGVDAAVQIDDPTISREHALIEPTGNGWTITQRGQSPLVVNGAQLPAGPLADGDRVELGRFTLVVEDEHPDEAAIFAPGRSPLTPLEPTLLDSTRERTDLLEQARVAQGPHLVHIGDVERVAYELEAGFGLAIGWSDACTVRLEGRRLFGKIAATVENHEGVIWLRPHRNRGVAAAGQPVQEPVRLANGAVFEIEGLSFVYQSGML